MRPRCETDTVQEVVDSVIADFGMRKANCRSRVIPPTVSAQRPGVEIAAQLRAAGFVRAQVDGELVRLDDEGAEQRVRAGKDVLVIVDRIDAIETNRGRLADAVSTAFSEGEGVALALNNGDGGVFPAPRLFELRLCRARADANTLFLPIIRVVRARRANGFGAVLEYDESLIVPDPRRSLADGALDPWTKPRYEGRRRLLRETPVRAALALDVGWKDIPRASGIFCCTTRAAATSASFRSSSGSRRSAISSTSASSCDSTSSPRRARDAAAHASNRSRSRSGSLERRSRKQQH